MFRALLSFRNQGIEAVPSACAHRATQFDWGLYDFLPSAKSFAGGELHVHVLLTERKANLQRERQGYWQRILSALHN